MSDVIIYKRGYNFVSSKGEERFVSYYTFERLKAEGRLKTPYVNEKRELVYEVINDGKRNIFDY